MHDALVCSDAIKGALPSLDGHTNVPPSAHAPWKLLKRSALRVRSSGPEGPATPPTLCLDPQSPFRRLRLPVNRQFGSQHEARSRRLEIAKMIPVYILLVDEVRSASRGGGGQSAAYLPMLYTPPIREIPTNEALNRLTAQGLATESTLICAQALRAMECWTGSSCGGLDWDLACDTCCCQAFTV